MRHCHPRRRRWFHCTEDCHGRTWTVGRTAPRIMGPNEPTTPRLCVSPTIAGCLAARLWFGCDIKVYRTTSMRSGVRPRGVWDALITGEHWLIPPVTMELYSVIPGVAVERHAGWVEADIRKEGCATLRIRARQYIAFVEMLRSVAPSEVKRIDRDITDYFAHRLAREVAA